MRVRSPSQVCSTNESCWLLVAGCWLLVAGCWLLVAGCWLLVAGCWLLVAGCWLLVAGCWLLVAGCWLRNWPAALPRAFRVPTDNRQPTTSNQPLATSEARPQLCNCIRAPQGNWLARDRITVFPRESTQCSTR